MVETTIFGPVSIRFDGAVLRPRPWTLAQAEWAAELAVTAPAGRALELCAGAGQIGLAFCALSGRDLVQVDAHERACELARHNADEADLPAVVEVRLGDVEEAVRYEERFAVILADPPWVRRDDVERHAGDPEHAIDGGIDGLDLARRCLATADAHLAPGGVVVLQLGDQPQVEAVTGFLAAEQLSLSVVATRLFGADGVLVHLA